MNRIILIGRLTTDPETKVIEDGGKILTRFILAVDRNFKSKQGEKSTDFIPIVLWGKRAEAAANYLLKGSKVTIEGRLQSRSFDDKNGEKKYIFEVIADGMQFIDLKKNTENAV